MPSRSLVTENAYKILVFVGTVVLLLTPYLSWSHFTSLKPYAVGLFEQSIMMELDLNSLNQQALLLKKAIDTSSKGNGTPESVKYSEPQLEQLRQEADSLRLQIADLNINLAKSAKNKRSFFFDISIALALTVFVLVVAGLLVIIGMLGWAFHIKVFEERRSKTRD